MLSCRWMLLFHAGKAIFRENNFANGRRRVTLLPLSDCHVGRVCDAQVRPGSREQTLFPFLHFIPVAYMQEAYTVI